METAVPAAHSNTVKLACNDHRYNNLSVIMTVFQSTYNFPMLPIEAAAGYSKLFLKMFHFNNEYDRGKNMEKTISKQAFDAQERRVCFECQLSSAILKIPTCSELLK